MSSVPLAKVSQAASVMSIARRAPLSSVSALRVNVCPTVPSATLYVAPFVTYSEDAATATGARIVPPSTEIAPVNVCAAGNVSVPAPRFVKPYATPPEASVTVALHVTSLPSVSTITLLPDATVKAVLPLCQLTDAARGASAPPLKRNLP